MVSLCPWISLLSEFHSSQAALKQLAYPADKALPCTAGPDVLTQGSVLAPEQCPSPPRASPGAWQQ